MSAQDWIERAEDEFNGGNWERAGAAALIAQAHATVEATEANRPTIPTLAEECPLATSHDFMRSTRATCPRCGFK